MKIDLDKDKYEQLLKLTKDMNKPEIQLPDTKKQSKHGISGKFQPKEKFTSIINRKGHVNLTNFTLIMRSNTQGIMMRFDISGADHNGVPTPHLHIFDGEHNFGSDILTYDELPEQLKRVASDPANLLENVSNFLEYNNVDLVGVQIIPSIL